MFRLKSINIFTYPFFCIAALLIITAIKCIPAAASVTSAPLMAYHDNLMTDNMDLSVLIGTEEDKDRIYKEYNKLEQEYSSVSVADIMVKASHYFVNRKNMEKGAMLFMVTMSRLNDSLNDRDKLYCAAAYGNMGYYLIFERNNPIQAYPFLVKALEILDKIDFKDTDTHSHKVNTVVAIYTNIAKVFADCRDFPRALHYYKFAYKTAKEDNNAIALPLSFTDLLHYGWTLDSISSIKMQIQEFDSLHIPNNANRYMYEYAKTMAKGAERYSKRNYNEALLLVDSASNTLDPYVDDRRYFVTNRIIAGKIAMENKDFSKASEILNNADSLIREEKLEDLYELIYSLRYHLNMAMGNRELAQVYRNEGLRVRDSLNRMHSSSVLHNMELSMQAKDLNERLSDSKKETQIWIYIALAAVALILIICVLVVRILLKNRRLKEQSESLFRKNLELMDATRSLQQQLPVVYDGSIEEEMPSAASNITTPSTEEEPADDASGIYRRILEYMADSPEIFSSSFTIESLAERLDLKLKPVSQAINSIGGKNFNSLLAEFRIKKACKEMLCTYSDPSKRPTIETLAEEVGYKSRTHFMRVFKSVTGMTTTEFLREAKNNTIIS